MAKVTLESSRLRGANQNQTPIFTYHLIITEPQVNPPPIASSMTR